MAIAATLAAIATPRPRTYLNSIWAYGENVTDSLRLNHKQNNLRFFCSSEPDICADSLSFRFMLKGYDNSWISPSKRAGCFTQIFRQAPMNSQPNADSGTCLEGPPPLINFQ